MSQLIAGLIESHDRNRFETIGVSLGGEDGSEIRARMKRAFHQFIDIENKSDSDAVAMLQDMGIDIAVDLMGFTKGARPRIFAMRAAPIQVNYIGFPGTMGADYIDYIIADRTTVPEEHRGFYREKVVYLPDTYLPTDPRWRIAEQAPSRMQAGLPQSGFVFCCFNSNYKLTPEIFAVWMRLLHKVDSSVLWLLQPNASAEKALRREAGAHGIDGSRLVFAPFAPHPEHLARHRLADLFLDTLPYGAHTTACDALFAGLPMVTCTGESFASRVGASLLNAVGMSELITGSPAEYEALALRLAQEPAQLASAKVRLARNKFSYPLFDTKRFTREIEAAFLSMSERHRGA